MPRPRVRLPGAETAKQVPTALPGLGSGTVTDIRIEGAQRIEPETVRSYLLIRQGDPWDEEQVNKSLKALFATGLFADVRLDRDGNTLVVKVVENPIINRIAFEGNSKLNDKDLNAEIQAAPARRLHPVSGTRATSSAFSTFIAGMADLARRSSRK